MEMYLHIVTDGVYFQTIELLSHGFVAYLMKIYGNNVKFYYKENLDVHTLKPDSWYMKQAIDMCQWWVKNDNFDGINSKNKE